jgi:hypothetical protein
MKGRATIRMALWATFIFGCVAGELASGQRAPSVSATPLMDQASEMQMALSAAPEYLRQHAGVYVLAKEGFRKVRESENGFNCLVGRQGVNVKAPVCYDEEGSATTLKASLRYMLLVQQGHDEREVERLIDDEYRTGRLLAPRRAGIAYMLSPEFTAQDATTGATRVLYPPHVMIYAPYLKNSDLGVTAERVRSHSDVWVLNEGRPDAYIIVPAMLMEATSGTP